MKNSIPLILLVTCLFLLNPTETQASHLAGGSITYEYVGDSTGVPYQYCITLVLYRREQGVNPGNTQTISISSSCYGSSNLNLPFAPGVVQGQTPRGDTNCIDQSDPGYAQGKIEEYIYSNCTVLPGKCADYIFSWRSCCRNANITNLQNPGSSYIYLDSRLNNTLGPNTSPEFLNPGAKFFCVGQAFTWSQAASEPDQDSLYYTLAQPWDNLNVPIPWAAGFSTQQPMTTANGFNLNPYSGVFTFTPTQPEVDVIKIVVKEYRFDTVSQLDLLIGTAIREMQIPVLASCNPIATTGISITQGNTVGNVTSGTIILDGDSLLNIFKVDSMADFSGGFAAIDYMGYDCFDTLLTLKVNGNLKCSSISPDGSDFRLIGPDGVSRPIVGVINNCKQTLLTDEVSLVLHKPLDVNGNYLLQIKKGNDGNTIENECGFGVKEFFSALVQVDNCPSIEYKLENVTVNFDQAIELSWSINPNTYTIHNEELFNSWNILRAKAGDPDYYLLESLDDPVHLFARQYVDSSLSMFDLDHSSYSYKVQLVQNYDHLPPSKSVNSILLSQQIFSDSSSYRFNWTNFDGWDSPEYQLFMAKLDSSNATHDWQPIAGPDTGLLGYNWSIPHPFTESDDGIYAFKVEAIDPHDPQNVHTSESNWVYLELWFRNDPDIIGDAEVPNVFSPNGDNINDLFYVSGTTGYTSASIVVYNRWGLEVHKASTVKDRGENETLYWDGRDLKTEEPLSDGVYYYVVQLADDLTGQATSVKGQVNIIKN